MLPMDLLKVKDIYTIGVLDMPNKLRPKDKIYPPFEVARWWLREGYEEFAIDTTDLLNLVFIAKPNGDIVLAYNSMEFTDDDKANMFHVSKRMLHQIREYVAGYNEIYKIFAA